MKKLFEGLTEFVDHLGATGSVFLAVMFALVMFLLRSLADKGQSIQANTERDIELAEMQIENYLLKEDKIPDYYVSKYPFSVLKICNHHKRQDLITRDLNWQLIKTSISVGFFIIFYFIIVGFILFAIMRGLKKV